MHIGPFQLFTQYTLSICFVIAFRMVFELFSPIAYACIYTSCLTVFNGRENAEGIALNEPHEKCDAAIAFYFRDRMRRGVCMLKKK